MQLKVNGLAQEYDGEATVAALIPALGLFPDTVLVELNGVALYRREWGEKALQDGDRIEILRVVAGG